MYQLGWDYEPSNKISVDYATAAKWFSEGAAAGDVPSMNAIGSMYERSEGMKKDMGMATFWYSKAANAGDHAAQSHVQEIQAAPHEMIMGFSTC